MRLLALDTATPHLSIALFDGGRLIGHCHDLVGRGHAERLLPAIAALPDGGGADCIVVGCGPGSFTGVRIAIAAARALAFGWGAALEGFDTLALIAAQGRRLSGEGGVAVAIDGGHGEWFVAEPGDNARSLPPDVAARTIRHHHVAGARAADLVALRGWGQAFPAEADARGIFALEPGARFADVRPRYGRAPDAKPAATA